MSLTSHSSASQIRSRVSRFESPGGGYEVVYLNNIEQDAHGTDLATANVACNSTLQFTVPDGDVAYGTSVWSFGYPLTETLLNTDRRVQFRLAGRYLKGYVMRSFYHEHPTYGRIPSYELDMPTPAGLSGAPLVRLGSQEVIGVVYGSNDVATIEQEASVNPNSGRREAEIQRIVSFGPETLRNLQGVATGGLPLYQYIKC